MVNVIAVAVLFRDPKKGERVADGAEGDDEEGKVGTEAEEGKEGKEGKEGTQRKERKEGKEGKGRKAAVKGVVGEKIEVEGGAAGDGMALRPTMTRVQSLV